MSSQVEWKCYECGWEWEGPDAECPECTPKKRREERLSELWKLLEHICGKRCNVGICEHTERGDRYGNSCRPEGCPALPQAEKVLELFIRDVR